MTVMTSASYDGNLTSAEIELRTGTDLISKQLDIGDRRFETCPDGGRVGFESIRKPRCNDSPSGAN
jgi:hypothetical protein